jgi:hypothetical protein
MRMIAVLIAAFTAISVAAPAYAQMSESTRSEMARMRAQNPSGFDACYSLARQRGYSQVDHEHEGRALMNFINGCLNGRTR